MSKMKYYDGAYEFINNLTSFSELIADELACYGCFKKAQRASFIDSMINNFKAKFTLKIVFDDCAVTANFINNCGDLYLDYKVRQGRKVIEGSSYSFDGGQHFEWEPATPQEAYYNMIKTFREHINKIVD